MLDLEQVTNEVAKALNEESPEVKDHFIETYFPKLVNEIQILRNEKNFLELELTEVRSALEDN